MKNLITITALIAAGAIAANAELKPGDNVGGLAWNQLTLTKPTGTLSSSDSAFNWDGEQGDLTNSWSLLFTLTTSSSGYKYVFSTNCDGGSFEPAGLALCLNFSNSQPKIGLYNIKTLGEETLLGNSNISFESGNNVMLTFLKYDDAKKASTSKAGKFVLSTYNDGASKPSQSANFEVDKDQSNLAFLKDSGRVEDPGNTSRLWTNNGAEQFSNIKLAYGSTIPEPSAFGLLAGLGALALVGARRRRRK